MTSNLTFNLVVPQYIKTLENLEKIVVKAGAYADMKKIDASVLLNTRLFPDMFDFKKQIQISCDMAKFGAARLAGKEAPKFEDTEATVPQLRERIQKTVQFLKTMTPEDFEAYEAKKIPMAWMEGKTLNGKDYLIQHTIPNFYFHVTAAYLILRHVGVEVGKMDFVGTLPLN